MRRFFKLFRNPLIERELTTTIRPFSVRIILIGFPIVFALILWFLYFLLLKDPWAMADTGQEIFDISTIFMSAIFCLAGGILGAQSISEERQENTLELLLMSGLTPRQIVVGKTMAIWVVLAVMGFACLPALGICFVTGGVSFGQLFFELGRILIIALVPLSLGICLGTIQHSSKVALVATVVLTALAVPFMLFYSFFLFRYFVNSPDLFGPVIENWEQAAFFTKYVLSVFGVFTLVWLFLSISESCLLDETVDRGRPIRNWMAFCGPLSGIFIPFFGILVFQLEEHASQFLFLLGILLSCGIVCLSGRKSPRIFEEKKWFQSNEGNVLFALIVSGFSFLVPTALFYMKTNDRTIWICASILICYCFFISAIGVFLSRFLKPKIVRVVLSVFLLFGWIIAPASLLTYQYTIEPSSYLFRLLVFISPVASLLNIEQWNIVCFPFSGTCSVAGILGCWIIVGGILWIIGRAKVRRPTEEKSLESFSRPLR